MTRRLGILFAMLAVCCSAACGASTRSAAPEEPSDGASGDGAQSGMAGSNGPPIEVPEGGTNGSAGMTAGSAGAAGAAGTAAAGVGAGGGHQPDDELPWQPDLPGPCMVSAGDHEQASCASGACPIVSDVVLECGDYHFAAPGLRVAAQADRALLFTTAETRAFALTAQGGTGDFELLPESMQRTVLQLAQTQSGDVVLSLDSRTGLDAGSMFIARRDAENGAWVEEVVPVPQDASSRYHDFAIDANDVLHQWFEAYADDGTGKNGMYRHAQRGIDGEWTNEDVLPDNPESYYPRWSIGRDGAPIALSYAIDEVEGISQLVANVGGSYLEIGSSYDAESYASYEPVLPAVPATTADVPEVAVVLDAGELRIAWPSTTQNGVKIYQEVALPDVLALRLFHPCSTPLPPCDTECTDKLEGWEAYAATQTSDGRLWFVWSERHVDRRYGYTESCDNPDLPGCLCHSHVIEDDTTSTLHVMSFDFATRQLVERITLPMPALADTEEWSFSTPAAARLDARAFGDQLAIGMRVPSEEFDPWLGGAVRLLHIDTSAL